MRARFAFCVTVMCLCSATILLAQDAVKVDPKHYSVVSENDQVRILKVHYGPHEKSVMHSHPNTVAVVFSHAKRPVSLPHGKKNDSTRRESDLAYRRPRTPLPGKH